MNECIEKISTIEGSVVRFYLRDIYVELTLNVFLREFNRNVTYKSHYRLSIDFPEESGWDEYGEVYFDNSTCESWNLSSRGIATCVYEPLSRVQDAVKKAIELSFKNGELSYYRKSDPDFKRLNNWIAA